MYFTLQDGVEKLYGSYLVSIFIIKIFSPSARALRNALSYCKERISPAQEERIAVVGFDHLRNRLRKYWFMLVRVSYN